MVMNHLNNRYDGNQKCPEFLVGRGYGITMPLRGLAQIGISENKISDFWARILGFSPATQY
jgi:hypothetical protein